MKQLLYFFTNADRSFLMTQSKKEWLLLIHQIPPKPSYFRVRIWRRLQQVGAIAVKQSVYALPKGQQASEDFGWILKEIAEGGGEASVCEARFLEGLTDEQVVSMFQSARKGEYEKIIREARTLQNEFSVNSSATAETMAKLKSQLSRLRSRFDEIVAIDFFSAPERSASEIALSDLSSQLKGSPSSKAAVQRNLKELKGRTWVTRDNIFVDRIASAWLIRRFIDRGAKFKFVSSNQYTPRARELRFDMYEGEYTHEGDRSTFEVMLDRLGISDHALTRIAEIVHALDLKDEKFHQAETAGLSVVLKGIVMTHPSDKERLELGCELFDGMYQVFHRQKKK
jgi:hypothetical protein